MNGGAYRQRQRDRERERRRGYQKAYRDRLTAGVICVRIQLHFENGPAMLVKTGHLQTKEEEDRGAVQRAAQRLFDMLVLDMLADEAWRER